MAGPWQTLGFSSLPGPFLGISPLSPRSLGVNALGGPWPLGLILGEVFVILGTFLGGSWAGSGRVSRSSLGKSEGERERVGCSCRPSFQVFQASHCLRLLSLSQTSPGS